MRVFKFNSMIFACVLTATPHFGIAGDGKRGFEIADYYRTAFVGSPTVSANGKKVAFTVTRYELETGTSWSEIWMMQADGDRLRQMTFGRHHDGSPTFSPDGKSLLFVSDRGEGSQLYLLPIGGGEARTLTDFSMGLAGPVWSPDGKWIAVQAEVYPECGGDGDCNKKIADGVAAGPLKVRMTDELLYRHWTTWRDGRYSHVLLLDARSGEIVRDLTPGQWDSPTFSVGGGGGYVFSPNSREICIVSNHDEDQARSTNSDLWLVKVDGEGAVNITATNRGWDGNPVYSPDGRYIAFRSQATPGYESDLYRIGIYDRKLKATRYQTDASNFDNWINDLRWSESSDALYFTADHEGENPIYRIGLTDDEPRKIIADGAIAGWTLAADDQSLIYTRSRVGEPPEVFSISATGGDPSRLTSFNEALTDDVDIRSAETIWVEGEEGSKIQVFLVKPHDFDPQKKYPLILNVHGGPQSPWRDRYRGDWQVYPGKGYVVAFPNPTGSAGFGQDFVDAIGCDWGGRVYRDLMRVTDALEELPFVDSERVGAMGWSYGGYMMMWFAGHTDRFEAIASMMGVYDLRSMWGATEELFFVEKDLCGTPWTSEHYERWSPSAFAENFETPTLVITGEQDYRVPYTQSLHFFTDLQVQNVPSRLVIYPNSGHWPRWYEMAFYYLVHLDWFHQYLGGDAAPWAPLKFLRNQVFNEGGIDSNESDK
ncbi:MAG: S9 family peptidase [Acidobacteriota bacterium]|nr:S9 family peptidase [Acidobacteriota bacterium]